MYVLLHGFTGAPSSWARVAAELGPTWIPALPGHAGAPPVGGWDEAVDLLADGITRAGFGGAHLVGYSLGGRLALGLLAARPGLFRAVTVVGAQPGVADPADRATRSRADHALADRLEADGTASFVRDWEALPMWATQHRLPAAVLGEQRATRLAQDPAGLAGSLRGQGLGAMPDLRARLAVRVPVTVVVGGLDAKFLAMGRELAGILPRSALRVIPDVGHNVGLEAPHALRKLLAVP